MHDTQNMDQRSFLRASGVVHAATSVSIVGSIAFYALTLHLDTASFGAFHAFFTLTALLGAGQQAVAASVVLYAKDKRTLGSTLQNVLAAGALLAVVLCVVCILAAPLLRDFLHGETLMPFYFLGISAFPTIITGALQGSFNVERRFGVMSLAIAAPPLLRMAFTVVFLQNGYQELDAAWVIVGASVLTLACCLPMGIPTLWNAWRSRAGDAIATFKNMLLLFASSLLFGLALKFDVLWARHELPSDVAGSYTLLSSVALVVYFVSSGMGRVASVALRDGDAMRALLWSYTQIILAAIAGMCAFALAGEWALTHLADRAIVIDWFVLLPLFLAATGYALIIFSFTCLNVLTKHVHIGIGCVIVVAQALGFYFIGQSPQAIALTQCIVMTVLTVIVTTALLKTVRRLGKNPAPHPAEPHLIQHG